MRAQNRIGADTRSRAGAVLLTCLLGLALLPAARSVGVHKQLVHRVAVVAATSLDGAQFLPRSDQPVGLAPAAAETTRVAGSFAFTNSSRPVSSRTAHAPRVRGPPGQALA
ncbi:hypothetical protein [Jatrophihabitans sp.]|uniref:hypothetical protein n=1 Tax=Jatrophihabitans sp. TaxID=1932789 RepID=UPI0039172C4B